MIRVTALFVIVASMLMYRDNTVLTGNVKDCFQETVHPVKNVTIRAFDVAANRQMLNVLLEIDGIGSLETDPTAGARMKSLSKQLFDFLVSGTALASDTSDSTGAFTLQFAPTDSVFVVGRAVVEDEPYYFSYKVLDGRTSRTFLLDMSSGQCGLETAAGTIQRTVSGLIFQEDFNRADGVPGNNWEIRGNPAFWSIVGNVLKGKPTDATLQQILVANSVFGTAREEMVVQARMRRVGAARTTFPGIHVRHDAAGSNWYRWVVTTSNIDAQDEFRQILGGATTILSTSSPYNGVNLWQQFKLAVKDSKQQGWKNNVLAVNLTNTSLNAVAGRAGLSTGWFTATSEHHEYDDFAVYKGNNVTITGLPAGHKLRVGSRVALESGGTATVDLLEDLCPRSMVEVLNATDLVVLQHSPAGGVWGGDTYSYIP